MERGPVLVRAVYETWILLDQSLYRDEVAEQIASITGGKRLEASELGELAKEIKSEPPPPARIQRQKDLWDIPAIFILLVILTGLEWFMRRRENLV